MNAFLSDGKWLWNAFFESSKALLLKEAEVELLDSFYYSSDINLVHICSPFNPNIRYEIAR